MVSELNVFFFPLFFCIILSRLNVCMYNTSKGGEGKVLENYQGENQSVSLLATQPLIRKKPSGKVKRETSVATVSTRMP